MVYYKKTLKICHALTKKGEALYTKMLEEKADELLFKHYHPIKWIIYKFCDYFKK